MRWAVVEALPTGRLQWGVFAVNTVGSFLLGVIAAVSLHPQRRNRALTAAAGLGFCGSLTTFSTLAVSVASDLRTDAAGDGLVRLAVSVSAGIAAAWTGWHFTRSVVPSLDPAASEIT